MWPSPPKDPSIELEEQQQATLLREALLALFDTSEKRTSKHEETIIQFLRNNLNGDEHTLKELATSLGCDRTTAGRRAKQMFWTLVKMHGIKSTHRASGYANIIQKIVDGYVLHISNHRRDRSPRSP